MVQSTITGMVAIRTETLPECRLCGAAGAVQYDGLTDRMHGVEGRFGLMQCRECGFRWLSPRPLIQDLPRCYPPDYDAYRKVEGQAPTVRLAAGWRDTIRNLILSEGLGYTKVQHTAWWASVMGRVLAKIPLLSRRATFGWHDLFPPFVPGARLLDVGCGAGHYLARMREFGWDVLGIDLSTEAAEATKRNYGIPVHVGMLEEADFEEGMFVVVTMTHSLEHVPDPVAHLVECHRILAKGGRIIVTTPNVAGVASCLFGRYWVGLEIPRHLSLFTPRTLKRCLESAGFEVTRQRCRSYLANLHFELSLRIFLRGRVDGSIGLDQVGGLAAALAWMEWALAAIWPPAGNELMFTATKR